MTDGLLSGEDPSIPCQSNSFNLGNQEWWGKYKSGGDACSSHILKQNRTGGGRGGNERIHNQSMKGGKRSTYVHQILILLASLPPGGDCMA